MLFQRPDKSTTMTESPLLSTLAGRLEAMHMKATAYRIWTKRRGTVILGLVFLAQIMFVLMLLTTTGIPNTTTGELTGQGFPLTPYISHERSLRPANNVPPRHIPGLKCVQVVGHRGMQSIEGLGAVFRLNQVVPFLASYYQLKLGFPSKPSEHNYDLGHIFSDCGYRYTYATFPPSCTISENKMYTPMCARADCECMADAYHKTLTNLTKTQKCTTIGFLTDRFKTLRYSGCIKSLMLRYFGTQGAAKPAWEYDVVHYRMGDLANTPGGKSFALEELGFLIHALCKLSERDIVILTEGRPEVPDCRDGPGRVMLASDTSLSETFQIFQHAHSISVGVSGFAFILAEIATPKRVVVLDWHARFYRWVHCEKWTLVTKGGSMFHFESKLHMEYYAMSNSEMEREITFLNPGDIKHIHFNVSVPERVWSPQLMLPAVTFNGSHNDFEV